MLARIYSIALYNGNDVRKTDSSKDVPMFDNFDSSYFTPLGEPEMDGYDVAQICVNGHVVNEYSRSQPAHNSDHCPQCGAKTITACPKCSAITRGYYHVSGAVSFSGMTHAPGFCHNCGKPYPWTESRLSAAREYVREMEHLSDNEKGILERSLDDLVRDTPNTPVAAMRFKQLVLKAGPAAMEILKTILIEIMAEPAKRAIWG
jgi:hypothetical protein